MEDAVIKLQKSIENEIQAHFGDNFEDMVIQVSKICLLWRLEW